MEQRTTQCSNVGCSMSQHSATTCCNSQCQSAGERAAAWLLAGRTPAAPPPASLSALVRGVLRVSRAVISSSGENSSHSWSKLVGGRAAGPDGSTLQLLIGIAMWSRQGSAVKPAAVGTSQQSAVAYC